MEYISEIAGSTVAACHSGSFEPSKVLVELGLTKEEVDTASKLIVEHANEILKVRSG
jgi:cysteine sulfinate desulfinase/cysteine desulfurase-like protein